MRQSYPKPAQNSNLRVLSLLPSATEIVWALGKGDWLVGRSHECDFPEEVKKLPVVTRSLVSSGLTGQEIHNQVVQKMHAGLSLYEIDQVLLKSLAPDVVITQDQCEVCAVSLEQVERAVSDTVKKSVKVVSLKPHCLDDVYADVLKVGQVLGAATEAHELLHSLKTRAQNLKAIAPKQPPKVLALEWLNPPMIGGGWIPELIRMAGGVPLGVEKPQKFRTVTLDEVESYQADIICAFPCGFSLEKTLFELELEMNRKSFRKLSATKKGNFHVFDGNHFFNRSGPRLIDSAELLSVAFNQVHR